jgi:hypothetical protein
VTQEPDDNPNNASYKIIMPPDPRRSDLVGIEIQYREVNVRVTYKNGRRQDLKDLVQQAEWFIDRADVEFKVYLESQGLDEEIDALFGEEDEQ